MAYLIGQVEIGDTGTFGMDTLLQSGADTDDLERVWIQFGF